MSPFVTVLWASAGTSNPVVEATNTYAAGDTYQSFPVNLPASIASGDLLLLFANTPQAWDGTPELPSGWTALFEYDYPGETSENKCVGYYRVADGAEGSTVTVALKDSEWSVLTANTYRISNYQGTPEVSPVASGTSASPNPGSITASWAPQHTLFIAVALSSAGNGISYPTNYSGGITAYTGAYNEYNTRTSSATRTLENNTEDPGVFDIVQGQPWVAVTVAVRGAAA